MNGGDIDYAADKNTISDRPGFLARQWRAAADESVVCRPNYSKL